MKIKMTIGLRIGFGFVILIIFFLMVNYYSLSVINESQRINRDNSEIYVPSMSLLMEFSNMIVTSEKLIGNWVFVQSHDDTHDKNALRNINRVEYPELKKKLEDISANWEQEDQIVLKETFEYTDLLFLTHQFIMDELKDSLSYNNTDVVLQMRYMIGTDGEVTQYTRNIIKNLGLLTERHQYNVETGNIQLSQSLDNYRASNFILVLILIVGSIIISTLSIRNISRPLNSLRNVLVLLRQGKLPEGDSIKKTTNYEINQMASAMEELIAGLKEKAGFAEEIGRGNFDYEYKPLSDDDILGVSLIEMRKSLQEAAEEEKKRQIEDQKRNWATQGIAKFSELLRLNNDNIKELSFSIIKNLVKYLEANQGGVFILSDEKDNDEYYIELTACYAFERRKFIKKKVFRGEGIVGTCLQEGETIFLSEVPDNYVTITSGLGDSNPRSIIVVPLKLNDEIFGVIELASFKIIEPYQIEFVEKIGESIASTISSVKINMRTNDLLKQSQEQSEQMRAQEEEMRQNMEEMHATQEEMERKEVENMAFYNTIDSIAGIIHVSVDGTIKNANQLLCEKLKYSHQELVGKNHTVLFEKSFVETSAYKRIWSEVTGGKQIESDFKILTGNDETFTVKGVFGAIKDKYGAIIRLIFIITDFREV